MVKERGAFPVVFMNEPVLQFCVGKNCGKNSLWGGGGTTSQAKVLSCLTGVSRVADLQGDCVKVGIMQSIFHRKLSQ
jgi:hypothetical protein